MKRLFVFSFILCMFCPSNAWFDSPKPPDLTALHRAELHAFRTRVFVGFLSGFCSHVLFDYSIKANVLGIAAAATIFQRVDRSKLPYLFKEVRCFELANAYVLGAFVGVLVRRGCIDLATRLRAVFANPAAEVPLTEKESQDVEK